MIHMVSKQNIENPLHQQLVTLLLYKQLVFIIWHSVFSSKQNSIEYFSKFFTDLF